jgi:ABC-2 type transport system permease protein
VFAAVRALRAEEDHGRYDLILAGAVTRGGVVAAVLAALLVESAALWAATTAAVVAVGVSTGDVTFPQALGLGLAVGAPAALFGAIGALASQLATTHRTAQAIGGAVVAASLLARIVADVAPGAGWLRGATPLGWAEQLHPVTGFAPLALAAFVVATAAVVAVTIAIATRRDVGTGVLRSNRPPRSHGALLTSPARAAARAEASTILVWMASAGALALILGGFSRTIAEEARQSQLRALGTTITNASDYLSFAFLLFALIVALFAASHVGGIRDEEGSGRLETLLALPVGRSGWLVGRVALAAASTLALALAIGLLTWLGAASQDAGVSLRSLLEAAANCVPAALAFLGLGVLLFAVAPRMSAGAAMALTGVAFLLDTVAALIGAPWWITTISPFHHLAAVPREAVDIGGLAAMLIVALVCAAIGIVIFARRDLRTG